MKDIDTLITQMTLEEKASLCSGLDFWRLKGIERLGIPSIMVTDARTACARPARANWGWRTAFPQPAFPPPRP